jgi:integrase
MNHQLQRVRRDGDRSGKLEFSEPKNTSCRTVGLPLRAVEILRSYRKRQLEQKKLRAGSEWQENGLVFTSKHGKPLDAQNFVNRHYKPLLKRAASPIRFHDLRHSCLSLLAQRNEPIRDLQALAGHATAAFTLQRYTHLYNSSTRRTADAMSDILPDESRGWHGSSS